MKRFVYALYFAELEESERLIDLFDSKAKAFNAMNDYARFASYEDDFLGCVMRYGTRPAHPIAYINGYGVAVWVMQIEVK